MVVLTKMELVPTERRDFIRALLRLLLPPNAGSLAVPVESGTGKSVADGAASLILRAGWCLWLTLALLARS